MSDFTSTMEQIIADYMSQGTDPDPAPDSVYVGLHTGDPGDDGTANEVSASDYDRESTTADTDWEIVNQPSPTTFENSSEILFDAANSDWGQIEYVTLWNSASDGEALAVYDVSDPKQIDENDEARFPENDLSFDIN